jgi:hypothetical protein
MSISFKVTRLLGPAGHLCFGRPRPLLFHGVFNTPPEPHFFLMVVGLLKS